MKIADITSLLTKGYKPGDIKTIGDMAKDNNSIIELAKSTNNIEDLQSLAALIDEDTTGAGDQPPTENTQHAGTNQEPGESDSTPDFKDLYEKSQKEIEELKSKVENMQSENTRRDNSGNATTNADALADFAQACFY